MFRHLSPTLLLLGLCFPLVARGEPEMPGEVKPGAAAPSSLPAPATTPSRTDESAAATGVVDKSEPSSRPGTDPFSRLKVVTPREKLGPLASVRVRDKREAQDRSRQGAISISLSTSPKGAAVYYGNKLLGTTPLALSAQRGSTPMDVVIRHGGYMTLRTRLMRKVSRSYSFKLSPAKLR